MTPCEKLGYKVGDRFRVTASASDSLEVGSIVKLYRDDGTSMPRFEDEHGRLWYLSFDEKEQASYQVVPVKLEHNTLKTGDEITQDGKKYRVTLEEIPQYEFKPGMMCLVDWDKADASCFMHLDCVRVIFLGNYGPGRETIAYAATDGSLAIGYVNTSSLRPE